MQNIWLIGILITGLVGSGVVMGIGAMSDHDSMHHMMHGENHDECVEHEECEYEGEECPEHWEEECYEENDNCDEHGHMDEDDEEHGCWR